MNKFLRQNFVCRYIYSFLKLINYWTDNSCKDSSEGKPDPVEYQYQQYKITLKIEDKADRTAKAW